MISDKTMTCYLLMFEIDSQDTNRFWANEQLLKGG